MSNTPSAKESILTAATALINEQGGNTQRITARAIAQRAGVGLGLINYHFGSKENLLEECVQRIIKGVIAGFDPRADYPDDRTRLTAWATHVSNFLHDNPAISRISILGDHKTYTAHNNTANTIRGFTLALRSDIDPRKKTLLAFILTAAMQSAFLSGSEAQALLGVDLQNKAQREAFIAALVDTILLNNIPKETIPS